MTVIAQFLPLLYCDHIEKGHDKNGCFLAIFSNNSSSGQEDEMRSVVISVAIAIAGGFLGAALSQRIMHSPSQLEAMPLESDSGWITPAIKGYGNIPQDSRSGFQPSLTLSNKVVFKVSRGAARPALVNPALDQVARVVNTYVAAGVPVQQLKFVVAVNGEATSAMLDNAHFRQRFGVDNPNLVLISELKQQGIDVAVCDQALAWHHYKPQWIATSVTHALSALTTISTLQNKGYALLIM